MWIDAQIYLRTKYLEQMLMNRDESIYTEFKMLSTWGGQWRYHQVYAGFLFFWSEERARGSTGGRCCSHRAGGWDQGKWSEWSLLGEAAALHVGKAVTLQPGNASPGTFFESWLSALHPFWIVCSGPRLAIIFLSPILCFSDLDLITRLFSSLWPDLILPSSTSLETSVQG